MNIEPRVRRLEHSATPSLVGCPYCRGDAVRRSVAVLDGVPLGPPIPEPCASCREATVIRRVVMNGLSDEQAAVARALAAGPAA
ncbi:MAG: hypothetical protein AB7G11_17560 [Phycisphaerales bacterium]